MILVKLYCNLVCSARLLSCQIQFDNLVVFSPSLFVWYAYGKKWHFHLLWAGNLSCFASKIITSQTRNPIANMHGVHSSLHLQHTVYIVSLISYWKLDNLFLPSLVTLMLAHTRHIPMRRITYTRWRYSVAPTKTTTSEGTKTMSFLVVTISFALVTLYV